MNVRKLAKHIAQITHARGKNNRRAARRLARLVAQEKRNFYKDVTDARFMR